MNFAPPLKVLVVDDESRTHQIIGRILADRGVEMIRSLRSAGVLSMIVAHRPALALIDVIMPGIEGTALVRLIRSTPSVAKTTVLLHSSLEYTALAPKAKQCGADGYIMKSRGVDHLARSLEMWLSRVAQPSSSLAAPPSSGRAGLSTPPSGTELVPRSTRSERHPGSGVFRMDPSSGAFRAEPSSSAFRAEPSSGVFSADAGSGVFRTRTGSGVFPAVSAHPEPDDARTSTPTLRSARLNVRR